MVNIRIETSTGTLLIKGHRDEDRCVYVSVDDVSTITGIPKRRIYRLIKKHEWHFVFKKYAGYEIGQQSVQYFFRYEVLRAICVCEEMKKIFNEKENIISTDIVIREYYKSIFSK